MRITGRILLVLGGLLLMGLTSAAYNPDVRRFAAAYLLLGGAIVGAGYAMNGKSLKLW